jgi:glyoxylase-like metal-dependent hydrolase (beta-lactamase superfamily II)
MSPLEIITYPNGKWRQNCYIVSGPGEQALIIDPGSDSQGIESVLTELNVSPSAIMNTHGHFDHIGAIAELQAKYQIPFFLHIDDANLLKRANVYKLLFESKCNLVIPAFDKDYPHSLADEWNYGEFSISVIHTPGHTPGSVCLLVNGVLFSGDTLLPNGPGRFDLPGGNKEALICSIKKLRNLTGDTMVYPGHGKPFSLQSFYQRHHGT